MNQLVFILIVVIALAAVLLALLVTKNNEAYLLRGNLDDANYRIAQAEVFIRHCQNHHVDEGALSIVTLIFCADEYLSYLEDKVGMSRKEAVNSWIEDSAWGDVLPMFIGHKGSDQERLEALRNVIVTSTES